MVRICEDCEYDDADKNVFPCSKCVDHSNWIPRETNEQNQTISLHRLNGLKPTVESCTMKVLEEVGELMQLLGKGQRRSGETEQTVEQIQEEIDMRMVAEALDVAQSATTMAYVLCEKHGMDIGMMMLDHNGKLGEKGYLV